MIGLLGRAKIEQNQALIIGNCNSIHMFFMRFAIDVIFIDKEKKVVGFEKNIKPFQLSKIYWKSTAAIELATGVIDRSKTQIGDQLSF